MLRRLAGVPADPRGMTLAEVLVATVILSVGLIGLAAVIPLSVAGVHEGRALSSATFLAEQKLEEIRNAVWSSNPAVDCLGVGATGPPESTTCTRTHPPCQADQPCVTFPDESPVAGHPAYSRTVRVSECVGSGCAGVVTDQQRLVRVTVTYRAMSGTGAMSAATVKSAVLDMVLARRR